MLQGVSRNMLPGCMFQGDVAVAAVEVTIQTGSGLIVAVSCGNPREGYHYDQGAYNSLL